MQRVPNYVLIPLCIGIVFIAHPASGQEANRITNAAMLDSCAHSIAVRTRVHFPAGHIDIIVDSSRDAFFLTGPLYRAAHDAELLSTPSGTTNAISNAGVCTVHIEAAEIRYSSLSGVLLRRTANIRAAIDIRDLSAHVMWSGVIGDSLSDTIRCEDASRLENPNIPATLAPNPCAERQSVAESLLEPLVLAAASATIVLLLFTVRSQ